MKEGGYFDILITIRENARLYHIHISAVCQQYAPTCHLRQSLQAGQHCPREARNASKASKKHTLVVKVVEENLNKTPVIGGAFLEKKIVQHVPPTRFVFHFESPGEFYLRVDFEQENLSPYTRI